MIQDKPFKRDHHQKVHKLLSLLNVDLLAEHSIFFAGGTACSLLLNEYRLSTDIDFLVDSIDGFSAIRSLTNNISLGQIATSTLVYAREVKADRDGIRTYIIIDDTPIKIEFVLEARIKLDGDINSLTGVPTLSRCDLMAEKLLANDDRGQDMSTYSRDIIDLSYMIEAWGDISDDSWKKVIKAYGPSAICKYNNAIDLIHKNDWLSVCVKHLDIPINDTNKILRNLNKIDKKSVEQILHRASSSSYQKP